MASLYEIIFENGSINNQGATQIIKEEKKEANAHIHATYALYI